MPLEGSPAPTESGPCAAPSERAVAPLDESRSAASCGALELWALGPNLKLSEHLAEIERMLTPVG